MNPHLSAALWCLTGLLRSRIVVCMVGITYVYHKPEIGQWVVSLCGMALGVSAIDAWRGNGKSVTNRDSKAGSP